MGRQLWHIATTVSVGVDGTVVVRRPLGELRTRAHAVRQVRPSAFVSGRNTPTVVETPGGWAYLVRARTEKEAVVAAILAFNPNLRIEI